MKPTSVEQQQRLGIVETRSATEKCEKRKAKVCHDMSAHIADHQAK